MILDVLWHDVECGGYAEDLPLWRRLAESETDGGRGPVLDVGAGTGRVSLDLAARGVSVVALDAEATLLSALDERAAGLPVRTAVADARAFALGDDARFSLIIVPMQTLQLLGGPEGRAGFLRSARAHLAPRGAVAAALADALESFDSESDGLPEPDTCELDGVRYASRPLAVVDEGDRAAIHRLRQVEDAGGAVTSEAHDVIRLDRVSAAEVAEEAEALGFTAESALRIPATDVYVGSTVVVLRG
ncbi:MAG TPA: class I SAM-dependent methyltransferase [Baekduia sp.]|uniref:class I SAM-dependent methyltransferase n=1 Tax=Baekduia sp. TaxID=2600305 RepID=UPI002CAADCBE|nr:class I SAM-dependent methyltransferase [Baekduia sp.]HMJ37544.1 class I SAM-dependent methyltransferase [Baekduia sp.]